MRKPPKCFDTSRHYGGNHVLFHNNSTSKLFPQLAALSQEQLSTMFNMPLIDREEEKLKELEFGEPHQERISNFRSQAAPSPFFTGAEGSSMKQQTAGGTGGGAKFIPINPTQAKADIAASDESVLVGTYYDKIISDKKAHATAMLLRDTVSTKSFISSGSALEASERIQSKDFLLAVDSDIARQVRELTQNRIKVNREILEEKSRSNRGQKVPGRPRADSPPKAPRPTAHHTAPAIKLPSQLK